VVYRGVCNFSTKALKAQNQGAVACLIINNVSGAPVAMGAGVDGANVTIPTMMISAEDGAELHDAIANGEVVAYMGATEGYFANNLAILTRDLLMAPAGSVPMWTATNETEFSAPLGGWVRNLGNQDQTGITMTATIEQGGNNIYEETSAPFDLISGDSLFVTFTDFSQQSYGGIYHLSYSVSSAATEELPSDNTFTEAFKVDSLLSFAPLDEVTGVPVANVHLTANGATGLMEACAAWQDPNASRLAAIGLHASAGVAGGGTLEGEFLEVRAYEWLDDFTGLSDANWPGNTFSVEEQAYGIYYYEANLDREMIYIPFENTLVLQDDVRYLFCVGTSNPASVFLGFNSNVDYDENITLHDQPVSVLDNNGTWYGLGFGTDVTAAVGVRMAQFDVNVPENTVNKDPLAYPNPANEWVRVPLSGFSGMANLRLLDMQGRVVNEQRVNVGATDLRVDVSGVPAGTYRFELTAADGRHTGFRVVVNK
jgi:hypothetical protein